MLEGDGRPPEDEQLLAKSADEQQLPKLVSAKQQEKDLIDKIKGYPPIADYALLSDCQSVALVSRAGSID